MRFINNFVVKFWRIFCICVFLGALIIKAMYNMADFPYFVLNKGIDIVFLVLFVLCYRFLYIKRKWIQQTIRLRWIILLFSVIAIIYILILPIKPFSDMQQVTEGALLFSKMDIQGIINSGYLQYVTKNLKVSLFYGILGLFMPKTVFSFRMINIGIYILISYFIAKIAKNLGFIYTNITFIYTASFLPLLLYCNHIYFDLPTFLFCVIAIYIYTKNEEKPIKSLLLCCLFLGLACCMRVLAYIFLIAILADYLFNTRKEKQSLNKKIFTVILCCVMACSIPLIFDKTINHYFRAEGAQDESIWTLFWMGINEYEFGMMHNEILDGNKSFDDFFSLLISRDAKTNIQLFGKKIFWTWSQGTWQAQKYGFGGDAENALDKFEYETPVTKFFLNNEQLVPKLINTICRAQYVALLFYMILGLKSIIQENNKQYMVFVYICFGTFLILIFYEMKSRYVLHCFLSTLLIALLGLNRVDRLEFENIKLKS